VSNADRAAAALVTRGNDRQPIYFANWSGKLFRSELLGFIRMFGFILLHFFDNFTRFLVSLCQFLKVATQVYSNLFFCFLYKA